MNEQATPAGQGRSAGYTYEKVPLHGEVGPDVAGQPRMRNWPAVYVLDNQREVYVGESTNVLRRRDQHRANAAKAGLSTMRIILHDEFNKSAALDLESYLIRMLGGDDGRVSLNGNVGLREHDYFDRARYREQFHEIFERLRQDKVFSRRREEILNSTLYKLSPFKALTPDQERSLAAIVEGVLEAEAPDAVGPFVVQGGPGTGKTVLGVFLMKLLADLAALNDEPDETDLSTDEVFHPLFTLENRDRLLKHAVEPGRLSLGIVVPQQSLRKSLTTVFKRTPGLDPTMVLDPWDVGQKKHREKYDLLIVDEAHRLNLRASQSSGFQNALFPKINEDLFGQDAASYTQLDWIRDRSVHQVLLIDPKQTVRPADLDAATVQALLDTAHAERRYHPLTSQLRVRAADEYVDFFSRLLRGEDPPAPGLGEYELLMFTDFRQMHEAILQRDQEHGLARLAAGYAWPWQSKRTKSNPDPKPWDIRLDGHGLPWNRTDKEWVTSAGAENEVGSIHTLQGYDLNYTGVVIGEDLVWNETTGRVDFVRANYHDKRGKRNNAQLGISYTDEQIREYVINVYNVLLTRGIRGTFLYVVDKGLRTQFEHWFSGPVTEFSSARSFSVPPGARPGRAGRVDMAVSEFSAGFRSPIAGLGPAWRTPTDHERRTERTRRGNREHADGE